LKDGEQITDLLKLNPEDLLLRWFNFHLTAAGHPNKINNFTEDIKNSEKYLVLLNQLNKQCDLSAMGEENLNKRAQAVLNNAKKLNVESYITPNDIVNGNQKLNVLFTAAIFNECHGLDPPTEEEFEAAKLLEDDVEGSREERSFRFWMNSLNIPDVYFNNLYEDCKSGLLLLKVIDKISPGSVEWKNVEKNTNNKFKKVANCNCAIDAMKKGGFKVVAVGGMDIHDGNKKLILGLIWQLMRQHSLKIVGGKTEEELIAWGNLMSGADPKVTTLKDKTLKNSLWFIKIMGGIEPRAVNWELVHQDGNLYFFVIYTNCFI
jgi:plastin-1